MRVEPMCERGAITVPTVTLVASAASATATIRRAICMNGTPSTHLVAKPVAAEANHLSCGLTILVQAVAPWSSMVTGWAIAEGLNQHLVRWRL